MAQSQFAFTPFAQLSTITGIYGITFIINWFASITFWISENDFKTIFIKNGLIIFGVFFMIILGYGFTRISTQPEGVKNVKVATISGTFDLHELAKSEKEVLLKISEKPDMKIPSSFFSSDKEIDIHYLPNYLPAFNLCKLCVYAEPKLEKMEFLYEKCSGENFFTELGNYNRFYHGISMLTTDKLLVMDEILRLLVERLEVSSTNIKDMNRSLFLSNSKMGNDL